MALIEKKFIGANTTHPSHSSVKKEVYYWNVSGLKGKIKQIKIEVKLRTGTTINNSNYHICLLNTWTPGDNDWRNYNSAVKYHYGGAMLSDKNHQTFGNHLIDTTFSLNLTGGASDVSKTITIDVPEASQDANLWNTSIKLAFYDGTGKYSPELLWGTSKVNEITFYSQESQPIKYYNGSGWVDVVPYYYNGSSWVECSANYYDGSAWRSCST